MLRAVCICAALISMVFAEGKRSTELLPVYTDYLDDGFSDWSWAPVNWASQTLVYGGEYSIDFTYDGFKGLYLQRPAGKHSLSSVVF